MLMSLRSWRARLIVSLGPLIMGMYPSTAFGGPPSPERGGIHSNRNCPPHRWRPELRAIELELRLAEPRTLAGHPKAGAEEVGPRHRSASCGCGSRDRLSRPPRNRADDAHHLVAAFGGNGPRAHSRNSGGDLMRAGAAGSSRTLPTPMAATRWTISSMNSSVIAGMIGEGRAMRGGHPLRPVSARARSRLAGAAAARFRAFPTVFGSSVVTDIATATNRRSASCLQKIQIGQQAVRLGGESSQDGERRGHTSSTFRVIRYPRPRSAGRGSVLGPPSKSAWGDISAWPALPARAPPRWAWRRAWSRNPARATGRDRHAWAARSSKRSRARTRDRR